jgi:hypothetical protein
MGADKSAENNPNVPKFICPICLPKPQKFGIFGKKLCLGVRSPWLYLQYTHFCSSESSLAKLLSQQTCYEMNFLDIVQRINDVILCTYHETHIATKTTNSLC